MKIRSEKDLFAGLMFVVIGIAFACGATNYTVGTGARMGPGYFPLMLGVVMAILGAVIAFRALVIEAEDGGKIGRWSWKPLLLIIGANMAFGALLDGLSSIGFPAFGLVVAIYALIFIASLAGDRFHVGETLVLATVLAAGSYVAFVWVLKMPFQVWPTFLAG